MKQAIIKAGDKEFILKASNRVLVVFEELAGKAMTENMTTKDYYIWLYATLYSSNLDTFNYTWDSFFDLIDEYPNIMKEFNDFNLQKDLIEPKAEPEKKTRKKRVKH